LVEKSLADQAISAADEIEFTRDFNAVKNLNVAK